MIASTKRLSGSNALRAALIWLMTCATVYSVLNGIATRTVPVHVEAFRDDGMNDEQVLSLAVQGAYHVEENGWWIHTKNPYLVFDNQRSYQISPELYEAFDLEMLQDAREQPIAILRQPNMASMSPTTRP